MLEKGIIGPSQSSWGFAVVIEKKKDGEHHFCVEFRPLNRRVKADKWPIQDMELIDEMKGCTLFTTLDLFTGYWNIRLGKSVQEMKKFRWKYGAYFSVLIEFGGKNGTARFQRMAVLLLGDLTFVIVYIDDIFVKSNTLEEHLRHMTVVPDRLRGANLKL